MSFDPALPDESVNVARGSVLGEASTLLVGVAACAVATVAALSLAMDIVVSWLPPTVEARLFGGIGSLVESGQEHPAAPALQELVDRLDDHWEDAPYDFVVGVLEAPQPNAVALPGGVILVTEGLLDAVETENELAFVLGHELGHFRDRDHLRGLGRELAWALVLGGLGLGEGLAGSLAQTAGGLSGRHFDRRQESEADAFGLEILVAEYGHAGGSAEVFERVLVDPEAEDDDGEAGAADTVAGWLSSHPASPDRIVAMRELARVAGWPGDGPRVPWERPAVERADASGAQAPEDASDAQPAAGPS